MKVHYYKQFFPGTGSAGTMQPMSLMKTLADRGHQVTVVSTDFNVTTEKTELPERYDSPSGGWVRVERYPSPRGFRASLRARLTTYGAFMGTALYHGMRLERPDVIVASIQPLFTGLAALAVATAKHVPLLLEVRDIWPDALEAKGAVTGWKLYPLYGAASLLYHAADRIVSLTPGIKKELVAKGFRRDRVDVFPNGFDPTLFEGASDRAAEIRERYGWGDDFVAVYVGTHTEVIAIDTFVRTAEVLRGTPGLRLELVGSGQTKPAAMALADDLGLDTIHFRDPVPKHDVPAILAAADVTLMSLFTSPLIHIYFENKFLDYMGSGKPILAAMGGEQAAIIERCRTGRVVPAFDARGLAELILDARARPDEYRAMGERGRQLIHDHFLLTDVLRRYADRIEEVARGEARDAPAWEPLP